jgi:hypothetical protein
VRRLPFIAIIREAYAFTFAHLGAIIGLIWLPMILVTVGGFFVSQHYAAEIQAAMASGNAAAAGPAVLALLFFLLAKLALTAMMYVPVTQLALGQRQAGAMIYFSFGPLEWRMFRALFGLVLFLVPPAALVMLVAGQFLSGSVAAGGMMMAAALALLLLYAGLAFVFVRIAALLIPVVVAEDKPALIRSWLLSAGNFWRLVAVILATAGPIVLLTAIVEVMLSPPSMGTSEISLGAGPNLPLIAGLEFLLAPLLIGLTVSASVYAWRALSRTDLTV